MTCVHLTQHHIPARAKYDISVKAWKRAAKWVVLTPMTAILASIKAVEYPSK